MFDRTEGLEGSGGTSGGDAGEFPGSSSGEAASRPGVPWERRDELGVGAALVGTVSGVLMSPTATYRAMRRRGGWVEPLVFAVVIGTLGAWAAEIWQMLSRTFLAAATGVGAEEVAGANSRAVILAVLTPGLVAVITVIGAAITHLMLMLFGGAPHPWETTLRVNSYALSAQVFGAVPLCGFLIALAWGAVAQVIGLREAHEVPTGRAVAAVLVPMVVSCFCAVLLAVTYLSLASVAGGTPS